jgi:hypothetical protein
MATVTVRRKSGIAPVRVAGSTLNGNVCSGQRKSRRSMIECRRCPCNIRMAHGAVMGELVGHMIRSHNCRDIRLMTAVAIGRQPGIFSVRMAGNALNGNVRSGQREGCCRMAKCRRFPHNIRVTNCAVMRELIGRVIWCKHRGEI